MNLTKAEAKEGTLRESAWLVVLNRILPGPWTEAAIDPYGGTHLAEESYVLEEVTHLTELDSAETCPGDQQGLPNSVLRQGPQR